MNVLEQGHIYFFYRPRVETHEPESREEVQRLYMILHPRGKEKYRMVVIGRKKLPEPSQAGSEKYWGFVDRVVSDPKQLEDESLKEQHYDTATRGKRTQPAARPAGEGVYAIVDHDSHAHLAYVLELPKEPGPVQQAMNIEEEASYVIAIKNPETLTPPGVGLSGTQEVHYPRSLQEKFEGKRWLPPTPQLLDYEGAELLLISAAEDIQSDLGLKLDTDHESGRSAAIFKDLRLEKGAHPLEPLFRGEWA
jgi:hypothetical protein